MALLELRIIVALINQRFRLNPVPGDALQYGSPVISLRPLRDVPVRLRSRESSTGTVLSTPRGGDGARAAEPTCPYSPEGT